MAARLEATFKIKYPETIIRKSNQVKDAAQGGWVWTAPFLNYKVFKGDMEQSTLSDFRANLAANMAQQQTTIDLEFPPNQPNQTRDNAIFSEILRRGNRQANKLLECLVPFIDVLIGAKVPAESAWLKGLSIYKTIFD